MPLRWYALYQKGKKVLPREQCGLVAESMEIDEGSCEEALQFFNHLNMLFYFPDILPNLVFMEPQLLLDKVTELVEDSYRMSQEKIDQPFCPIQREDDEMKFLTTDKFLGKFDSLNEKPLFHTQRADHTAEVLTLCLPICQRIMPCLLQVKTPEVERDRSNT